LTAFCRIFFWPYEAPIPDLPACEAGIRPGCMSMCAGDFVEVYGDAKNAGQWDAVATCFFIDTGHNVVEYLEIISRCLRPGGVWVNFGRAAHTLLATS